MSYLAAARDRCVAFIFYCVRGSMPESHARWVDAMEAESRLIGGELRAVCWAVGCLLAAAKWRFSVMVIGDLRISRWVLAPELLLCFGPLAFGWLDVVWGDSGVTGLTPEIVQKFFLTTPRGVFMLVYMILEAVLGILGPIALIFGATFVVFKRPVLTRTQAAALLATAAGIAAALLARLVFDWVAFDSDPKFGGFAGSVLLFSLLPAAGIAHMYYLGSSRADQVAPLR